MIYLLLFILGLATGSFINVISLRYQSGEKLFGWRIIGGRSHCRSCHKILSWYELIPLVSFAAQLGRCRSCKERLPIQYPVVELLSGLIFVFVALRIFNIPLSFADFQNFAQLSNFQLLDGFIWILVFVLFLLLSLIDLKKFVIPNPINLLLGVLGLVLLGLTHYYKGFNVYSSQFFGHYALIFGFRENIFINYFLGLLFGSLLFGIIIILSRGKAMGWGDFKLVAALGILFGWPEIIAVVGFSFVVGAVVSLFLMAIGRKKLKDAVPFGPFLVLGSSLIFFFGFQLIDAYFNFFNFIT